MNTLFNLGTIGERTDGQLLERFAIRDGEASELAFAALVERHGPMVLRVCRSILRDEHHAQDAFQATFLVLARRAGAVRKRDSVGSWLYGVALRVAACERGAAARRRAHERRAAEWKWSTTTSSAEAQPDLTPVLHEELGRLPERYRAALVLCHLEGLACEEAARRLGWPVGTVKSRLARGRERLRARLTHRGLAPAIGLGAVLAAEGSQAAVPLVLTDLTVQAAVQFTATKAFTAAVVSAPAAALAGKVVKAMLLTKLRMAAAITLAFGVVAVGMAALVYQDRAAGAPPQDPQVPVRQDRVASAPQKAPQQGEARRPEPGDSIPFHKIGLGADDLVETTFLDLYKYQVDLPKGQRFRVLIRERRSEDSQARVLYLFPFRKTVDGPTTFRVCFLRRDHTLQGVLLSQEKEAEFRFDSPGCNPSGIATNIPLPLSDIESTRKTCWVHKSDKENEQYGLHEMRLITIVASEPGKPAPPPTGFPRAELVIVKDQ